MWLLELLFGVVVGYYIMSETFRSVVNGIISGKKKTVIEPIIIHADNHQEENASDLLSETEPKGNVVSVSEDEIAKWFRENKELRKLNEVRN